MFFKFQSDTFSQAGKSLAKGSLITGLLLIGFGMLVFILRDLFAFLAAAIFFMAGFSAIVYAVKLFWASRKMGQQNRSGQGVYRENVEVHYSDDETNGL
jgi:hypothetical protein